MLLSALTSDFAATPTPPAPRPVLRMVPHERMVWSRADLGLSQTGTDPPMRSCGTIRDSGRIVGGALFGGPAGAAAGLANTIIAHETGSSVEGHALAMLRDPSAQKETLDRFASPNPSRLSPDLHLSFAAQPANLDPPAPARVRAVYRFND